MNTLMYISLFIFTDSFWLHYVFHIIVKDIMQICMAFPRFMAIHNLKIQFLDQTANANSFFPMHPFSTPWKHQEIESFSNVFRG